MPNLKTVTFDASQYRKKPVTITAHQWFKNGDHPQDYSRVHDGLENGEIRQFSPEERKAAGWEGDIVRYYRHPDVPGDSLCEQCGKPHNDHGWIDTLEQGHRVCPGDWIIKGIAGEFYPCKPDIFAATYEPAAAPTPAAQSAGQEAPNLEGLRDKLFDGRPVTRDAEGWYYHPALPNTDEDVNFGNLLAALRVESVFVSMEVDDSEAADRYGEAGEGDCHYWTPTPPEGDDWCLLAVYDTEDGPYALFGRDAYIAEQKRKQERTRQRAEAIAANQSGKGGE